MNHPFDLDISALENIEFSFAEELNEAAAEIVAGGGHIQCISAPCPGSEAGGSTGYPSFEFPRIKFPVGKESPSKEPPTYTTLAVGEEGGEVTTMAVGEEGGMYLDLSI